MPETQYNDEEGDPAVVPETQAELDAEPALSDNEDDSDYASDVSHSAKKRKAPATVPAQPADKKKEGVVEKVKRKISATAHANYQRLKIKGKSGNGKKPGGRFSRR